MSRTLPLPLISLLSLGDEVAISENGRVTLIVADEEELRGGRKWSCLDYNIDWVTVR